MLRLTETFPLPGLLLDMMCCSQAEWRGILSNSLVWYLEQREEKPVLAAEGGRERERGRDVNKNKEVRKMEVGLSNMFMSIFSE